ESKQLFISIGRNRRLFPRELIAFILSKTSAQREDIGIVRVLDNYSFVQVRNAAADKIIETLNGTSFRGRTLTVNFAKPKSDDNDKTSE
ncbi:MAG: DbpA RNA binding domain-containing protein, partial [Treponema sp.]|nr:DbpA RNA binding domain-containing protein [Treponema sp.]